MIGGFESWPISKHYTLTSAVFKNFLRGHIGDKVERAPAPKPEDLGSTPVTWA